MEEPDAKDVKSKDDIYRRIEFGCTRMSILIYERKKKLEFMFDML